MDNDSLDRFFEALRRLPVGAGEAQGGEGALVAARFLEQFLRYRQELLDWNTRINLTLQLKDVVAVHGRAEELAHKAEYRASFDVVTARAVASLSTLLEYAAPFCRVGGKIILPKKGDLAEELAQGKCAARQVGAVLKDDVAVTLPGLEDGRRLLVWEQVRNAPAQFPRRGSMMAKKPLSTAFQ